MRPEIYVCIIEVLRYLGKIKSEMNNESKFVLLSLVFLINRYRVECGHVCSENKILMKHAKAVDCEFIDNDEYINAECDPGYEFQPKVSKKRFLIEDVLYDHIVCTGNYLVYLTSILLIFHFCF